MAPSRRKGGRAAAAASARQQWKIGDLVLAKMKGFPAWPAMVSEPEKWGFSSDRKKLLVYFYGTKQIAFCNYADIEAFTEEKKKSLLVKRQGKGADFVRAVDEIIDIFEKKQKLNEVNSDDEGIEPHGRHFEGSTNKTSRKSLQSSPDVSRNNQLEAMPAAENHDALDSDAIPRISMETDLDNTSTLNNEPTEKISILDQLRQTPLSTTTTTRKRQRDGSLQSSVIQRVPSLRRSRSSSGSDPSKCQVSSKTGNGTDPLGRDLVSNVLQENPTLEKKLSGDLTTLCKDLLLPVSAALPLNHNEAILSDKIDAKDDSMVESNCKLEKFGNGLLDKDLVLNEVDVLNGKLDLPVKAAIFKKKRKPYRKRSTNSLECATFDKEADLQSESRESLSESPNSCKEIVNFIKANGDEHLPLVKRARVRMGKQSMEEIQLGEYVEKRDKLDLLAPLEEPDMGIKFVSQVSSCLVKETTGSSSVNDCALTAGRDPIVWKVNKFQLKDITLDVEAALPPSKRLHRALEAMSANVAEATVDTPEAPHDVKIIANGCMDSPNTNPVTHSVEGIAENPMRLHSIQSSDNTVSDNASGLSSCLALRNPEVAMLTLSEVEPFDTLTQGLRNPQKKACKDVLVGAEHCDGPCTNKMTDIDNQEKVFQPCSFKSVELMNSISKEGMSKQLSSSLELKKEHEIVNETLQLSIKGSSQVDGARETGNMKPIAQKPDSVSNLKDGSKVPPPDGPDVTLSAVNVASTAGYSSGLKSSHISHSNETIQAGDLLDAVDEVKYKGTPKDWCISESTPMKDLIAAAQAKLLSRSASFPDNAVDGKGFRNSVVSPSAVNKSDSSVHGSPQNSMIYHRPATDDRTYVLQNGSQSPVFGQQEKRSNKLTAPVEANVARRSFEALLCTLSRTKDSIGRATRLAIDCAKFGIAVEVIEILLQHLERESSLHKRVDLFFLVDSITQFSRSQKGGGGGGDEYLSLVQSVLPRILSAAAPHGNAAWENRRQCLKVLRLWLERKMLPEFIVRHHIRELESVNETSLPSSYSRRPSRTERALNDPIREMEGMCVDEYGSNTSFQLQHFIHPRLLEDEEGSSDDEQSFEAVTPEHTVWVEDDKGTSQTPNEKQCHILEDVDGELEMEDVAPPCGVEASSSCCVPDVQTVCDVHHQDEQHQSFACAPPLPEDLPPPPPPLPASPPPLSLPSTAPLSLIPQQQIGGSHSNTDITDFHLSGAHNNQNQQPHSVCQQPNNFRGNFIASESASYFTHGYDGFQKNVQPPPCRRGSSGPFSSHSAMHSGNNFQHKTNPPLPNKAYHLQPPPPTVSNQFSYIQAEPQQRPQSWSSSSYSDRFRYANGPQGGAAYVDRNIRGPIQHDNGERDRYSPALNTAPILPDKIETLPSSLSRYGPYSESVSNPSHGWSIPPRISGYAESASRSSLEKPIPRVNGAPGYWQPR